MHFKLLPTPDVRQRPLTERPVAILAMLALFEGHQERSLSMGQLQVARCIVGDQSPIYDKGYLLAKLVGLIHQVCGQQDSYSFLAELLHRLPYLARRNRVQATARLVKKEYGGPVQQSACYYQALLHTIRKGAYR